jgi:hypothetical protein
MEKVLVIADSKGYIKSNCFQKQLHESIKVNVRNIEVDYFYLEPRNLQAINMIIKRKKIYSFVVSTLRQRVLFNNIPLINKLIGCTPLKIYDQDPWNNYMDNSNTYDCYNTINSNFHLLKIYVTSQYWANYISKNDKLSSAFVKMGMLPELCNLGLDQSARKKRVEFKGTLYPHRQQAFNEMIKHGLALKFDSRILKYSDYLKYLSKLAIFVHDESGYWKCRGENVPMSTGLWVKDVEIASQGCFSIRNYHSDYQTYSLEHIPLIKFYRNPSEVKSIVEEIFALTHEESRKIQIESHQYIARNDNWKNAVGEIFETEVL